MPCGIQPLESERGFRLIGDLADVDCVNTLRRAIEPELHGTLVLDLAGIDRVGSIGMAFLLRALRRLREQGGSLVIRYPSGPVMRVLEVTGIAAANMPGLTIEPGPEG